MDPLADLNDAQRRAVQHVDGPLLVLAGAGSGKTLVITRRIAHLIARRVAPWNILAVTFTNKAAGEMAQRVEALGVRAGATICTFHAFAARLLRQHAAPAGLGGSFSIYDQDDQLRCVKEAMQALEISPANFAPRAVQAEISRAKNRLVGPEAYAEQAAEHFRKTVAKVYPQYDRLLRANRALDFDDLLLRTVLLFRDHPEIRTALSERYRYLLIDEYQDTNRAQYVIAHGIALEHENICATGDPDQSIYGWRGADLNNILEFESDYPDALVVRLEQNYRSTQPILTAASSLIARNLRRKHKDLQAVRPGGTDVQVVRLQDGQAEADEVARIVERLRSEGLALRDTAVFYRVNALSRLLEESFRQRGIAYQIARGVEFYNRKEIKDVLAYLRLILNSDDDLSCRRIINVPPRGIGAVTVARLAEAAQVAGRSLLAACAQPAAAGLGTAAAGKVTEFARQMSELALRAALPVPELIKHVLVDTGIEASLSEGEEQLQAQRNVQELVSAAAEFQEAHPEASLADYLYQVSLVSDIDSVDPQMGAVTFMTLHAAKGLEFAAVVMIGCEDGLLPFRRPDDRDDDVEEERRLAFVGMTRAKDRLFLTSARSRMLRGAQRRQVASPFLSEIGRQGVVRTDKSRPERGGRMSLEDYRRRALAETDPFHEDADQRAMIEAMEAADLIPAEFAGIRPGRRVWHPKYGPGQVLSVSPDGTRTRAVVQFDRSGRKTLILERAKLEPL